MTKINETLCACKNPKINRTTCLTCGKQISWETFISYWEQKVQEHKNEKTNY
jgi:DNA-directed RNA polymerase subunit N (RpoN/RPB10)